MYSLEELFSPIDDFCLDFEIVWNKQLITNGLRCRDRKRTKTTFYFDLLSMTNKV